MKLYLDLCSGSGGFSSAFKSSEKWEVITVDINPRYRPDIVLDLIDAVENRQDHPDFWNIQPDVILASPPCERWSIANSHWPLPGIYTATKVLGAVLEIISEMRPRGWIIENPKGRMRWFLHKPSMTLNLKQFGYTTVKPTDFWTNIDFGLLKSTSRVNPEGIKFNSCISRVASKRALMPLGLSQMILDQMEAPR
jgi:site-specific DNA-cytosine methylase